MAARSAWSPSSVEVEMAMSPMNRMMPCPATHNRPVNWAVAWQLHALVAR